MLRFRVQGFGYKVEDHCWMVFTLGTIATISRRGSWVQILDESYCQH